jgi:hypothetical protein
VLIARRLATYMKWVTAVSKTFTAVEWRWLNSVHVDAEGSNSASEPTIPPSRVWVCDGFQIWDPYPYPHIPVPVTHTGFETPADH